MIFYLFLILSLILFSVNIIKQLSSFCDNNLLFYIISIIILTSSLMIFLNYHYNLTLSLIISMILMIVTYIFILDLRNKYHQQTIFSLPFFIITIYLFAKIINSFLFLAHQ